MSKCSPSFLGSVLLFVHVFKTNPLFRSRSNTYKAELASAFSRRLLIKARSAMFAALQELWFLGIALVVFRMGASNLYLTLSFRSRYISSWFSFCLTLSVKINFFCLPIGHCPSPQEDGRKYKHWKDCFENLIKVVFGDPDFDNQIIKHSLLWLIYCYDFFGWTS